MDTGDKPGEQPVHLGDLFATIALGRKDRLATPTGTCFLVLGHCRELDIHDPPGFFATNHHDRDTESARRGMTLMGRGLHLHGVHDGSRRVHADVDIVDIEGLVDQVAGLVPLQPLSLVQQETARTDRTKVLGQQRIQRRGIGVSLGGRPAGRYFTNPGDDVMW